MASKLLPISFFALSVLATFGYLPILASQDYKPSTTQKFNRWTKNNANSYEYNPCVFDFRNDKNGYLIAYFKKTLQKTSPFSMPSLLYNNTSN